VTLEANPGTVDRVRLAELRDAGVNRLSLGVQSFDDELLGRIGRIHDRRQAVDGAEAAHAAGFGRLNLDLMYGLPGQSAEGAVRDLRTALSLGAGHLSWYQLTLERGTAFHRCPPVLPGEEEVDRTEAGGWALLAAAGLERYEVSAYALSGQRCRHNLGYWTFGDYLGVGPGAHGKLSHALPSDVSRRVKPRDPSSYLARPTGAERWRVGPEDLHAEFLLNALRLTEGVPSGLYAARTGLSPETLAPRVAEARRRGLMDRDPGYLRPSALGLRFLDDLLVLLTAEGGQTREA
jgi:oxygen-independent coproporphyrinogen-3 oxidase